MTNKVVEINHLQKIYGKANEKQYQALADISFDVHEGEFVGIMGPSGSGKTTLLNMISALDTPTNGTINIAGQNIVKLNENQLTDFRAEKIGFIFQDFNLLENLTMRQNIGLPLSLQGLSAKKIQTQVEKIADRLNIGHILDNYPTEVSGGQKQRVAAARALIHQPELLLGDEPTGALDSKNAKNLLEALRDLNEQDKTTILMVTHDPMSASYCKRILFIRDGEIFKEIEKQGSQQAFYEDILSILSHVDFSAESQV
ncbi:ABC transporter ATP-binding protein [Vagococcus xieshaowenii]|uniref:ABC transporter ATP-binding protein n=1 Tax=Vagococcus xieshaowenii TaxID=2562451 RepID=A0AAJ5EDT1_9ENTE|nr:ABC transporter ATP-binding protein [Vagococcus xieshaowenii]QCA28653.1 ABC transporter ATP-binding protein [Vagococcus xieshaowenii]TFZ40540.1 ABC transporter ATP-binding protein [Vagococcus xieshaowenii]